MADDNRLRVVSVCASLYIGGDANRLLAYSRAVDRARVDHSIVVLERPDADSVQQHGPMAERFAEHGVRVESLDEEPRVERRAQRHRLTAALDEARTFARIVRRLRRRFREQRVDVVDARPGYGVLFGSIAGRLAGVPVICGTEYGTEFWRRGTLWCAGQTAYRLLDVLVTDSQTRVDQCRDWSRLGLKRTSIIENGIYVPRSQRGREEMRREFGLPTDPRVRVIGQISRLIPYKGHRVLIDAAAHVLRRDPHTAFLICGFPHQPSYPHELRSQAHALGIGERVRVVSYPGPVADVWQAIDVHAHASLYDSSPIAIHESMALGLPAVVSDVGGIPRLVENEHSGLVVPHGRPDLFADALLRVLGDDALARRLGRNASERFAAGYQPERMARRTEDLFRELLATKRRRGSRRASA